MKTRKLKLDSGATGFTDEQGRFVCTGSQTGRRNNLPEDTNAPCKLQMERLKWVDRDFDQGGAYWGNSGLSDIYCAHGDVAEVNALVFVRAMDRAHAKTLVRRILPNATFCR